MFTNAESNSNLLQKRELGNIIEAALVNLPEDYRLVFCLREVNGLSTAETAAMLNITEGNVKVRLSRAKVMLRKKLEKNYSPQELFEFNLIYCDGIVDKVMKRISQL